MTDTLATALSTLAQIAATLAALIGFLGLWKLDRLRRDQDEAERDLHYLVAKGSRIADSEVPAWMYRPLKQIEVEAERLLNLPEEEKQDRRRAFPIPNSDDNYYDLAARTIPDVRKRLKALSDARQRLTRRLRWFLILALGILLFAFGFLVGISRFIGLLVILCSLLLAVATGLMVIEMAREPGT